MVVGESKAELGQWIERYEKHLGRQSEQIDALTRDVSALTADVRSLMKNQESLFNRSNRPFQWGALVAALSLAAVAAGLLITPMKEEDSKQLEFDKTVMRYMMEDQYKQGQHDNDLQWLKKLEERQNNRMHSRYGMDSG